MHRPDLIEQYAHEKRQQLLEEASQRRQVRALQAANTALSQPSPSSRSLPERLFALFRIRQPA
jgi:hypothetical protein